MQGKSSPPELNPKVVRTSSTTRSIRPADRNRFKPSVRSGQTFDHINEAFDHIGFPASSQQDFTMYSAAMYEFLTMPPSTNIMQRQAALAQRQALAACADAASRTSHTVTDGGLTALQLLGAPLPSATALDANLVECVTFLTTHPIRRTRSHMPRMVECHHTRSGYRGRRC